MKAIFKVLVVSATRQKGEYNGTAYQNTKVTYFEDCENEHENHKGRKLTELKAKNYALFDKIKELPAICNIIVDMDDKSTELLDIEYVKPYKLDLNIQ